MQYGYSAYFPSNHSRNQIIKSKLKELFENDQNSVVSVQNSLNYSSSTHRKYILVFPDGVYRKALIPELLVKDNQPKTFLKTLYADYVILDFKRPLFIGDKGCKWRNMKCQDQIKYSEVKNIFFKLITTHEVIFKYDEFYIFKK